MKLSVSLVSSLLLATLSHAMQPYHDYNWQFQNAIPYQHLLTEDEIVNYSVLAFEMSREELTELIRMDLVDRNILDDEADAPQVPVEDIEAVGPLMPVLDDDHHDGHYHPHHHIHPHHHHQPQHVQIIMPQGGHGQMVIQVPQGMNINDVLGGQHGLMNLLNMLGGVDGGIAVGGAGNQFAGMDPFTMSDDQFDAYLAFAGNFSQHAFNDVIAHADVNSAPSERVYRMLLAAAEHESFFAFDFLCDAMFKSLAVESGDTLKRVILEITKPGKDPRFLSAYLNDCTPTVAKEVGEVLNAGNTHLHQVFVNKCGTKIPVSILGNLVGVTLPEDLANLVTSNQTSNVCNVFNAMKLSGSDAEAEKAVLKTFDFGPIQIAAFFPNEEQANELTGFDMLTDVDMLAMGLGSVKDHIQFTVVHLDLSTGAVNIFKSPTGRIAPIALLRNVGDRGYEASEAVENFVQNTSEDAFHVSEIINPGDIIVGCSAEMAMGLSYGFKVGVADMLCMSFDHTSAQTVFEYLQQCNVMPKKTSTILIAFIPAKQTETEFPATS